MVVVGMGPDPKPHGDISIDDGKRAIAEPNPCGVDWLSRMDLFETEAAMIRVALEALIRFARAATNMLGKALVRVAEAAGCP